MSRHDFSHVTRGMDTKRAPDAMRARALVERRVRARNSERMAGGRPARHSSPIVNADEYGVLVDDFLNVMEQRINLHDEHGLSDAAN